VLNHSWWRGRLRQYYFPHDNPVTDC
jgi:hypothetical protein